MKKKLSIFFICCFSFAISALYAEVKLPHIFSDNMILQRDQPVRVWGWADKGETVEVSFLKQRKKVKADKTGKWELQLAPTVYGGPYIMEVRGKSNTITLKDIAYKDVF